MFGETVICICIAKHGYVIEHLFNCFNSLRHAFAGTGLITVLSHLNCLFIASILSRVKAISGSLRSFVSQFTSANYCVLAVLSLFLMLNH